MLIFKSSHLTGKGEQSFGWNDTGTLLKVVSVKVLQLGYCDSNCICTKFQLDLPIFYVYTTSTPSNSVLLT